MDQQLGRPVLLEFWDFCRVNSLRTLPYVRAWHERYSPHGLRVISAHAGGYPPSRDAAEVRAAVHRLEVEHPVVIDADFQLWREYGNEAWPARYLFDRRLRLHSMHYGEGAYDETELAIQELLGVERELVGPLRPEDDPDAQIVVPTADREGAYSGPYEAGGVWAVLSGAGDVRSGERSITVAEPGAFCLIEHERHTAGVLELEVGPGVTCHATCFTPGLAG
jgi:hypothetical protein